MTPLGPGGQNGGAGPVATALVEHLSRSVPEQELLLLTNAESHAELAWLERPNVRRVCVRGPVSTQAPWRVAAGATLRRLPLGGSVRRGLLGGRVQRVLRQPPPSVPVAFDLLFCPFTATTYARTGVPSVTIVHDLQYVQYPEFFTAEQRQGRERDLRTACSRAERVVCVSDYTRRTLLAHIRIDPGRVVTIQHGLLRLPRPPGPDHTRSAEAYLLYPANFWAHKNHARLFEGLRRFREVRPSVDLRLVCTGAPNALQRQLWRLAADVLGPDVVQLPGYVTDAEFSRLLAHCAAVVYPSLYEGFGLPVLEAMAAGKPVLCSQTTSLPEVAGQAALYFDPCEPEQISRAIMQLFDDPEQVARRVDCGRVRAATFGTAETMACAYQRVFDDVMAHAASSAASRPAGS